MRSHHRVVQGCHGFTGVSFEGEDKRAYIRDRKLKYTGKLEVESREIARKGGERSKNKQQKLTEQTGKDETEQEIKVS